jgi:hypothetical protein
MKAYGNFLSVIFATILFTSTAYSNNAIYEQRRTDYIDAMLSSSSGNNIILQAYRGLPLDTAVLNFKLNEIPTRSTSDFVIIELIRILFLTNGNYDSLILPVINSVPYWVNYGDTLRNYWSENHMIMWMGSDWLLHEKYGRPIDSTLDARLRHYLNLKIQYGFYEFFSSTYLPFSVSGLLNLADFSQDVQIKNLATQAVQRLLTDLLMLTNDKGVFFPAAGRNYPGKYVTPYGENHSDLIYLLTGFGNAPASASGLGAFLATSALPVDTVINSWTPQLNFVYHIGHTLDSGFVINSNMSFLDKVVFQWSSAAYFHPDVVEETVQILRDYNLWDQVDFAKVRPLAFVPPSEYVPFANSLSCMSKSTVISGQDVAIFKNNSITLSSVLDFWKGKVGYQQYTCMANVGTTAVFTASGPVVANWVNRNSNNQHVHLPYVEQKKNVALIMYRPEYVPDFLGSIYSNKDVALHWRDADFDEVINNSLWLLGRQESSYVAVRRSCIGTINTVRACETNGGQTWVMVVGDSSMYGSFNNFQNIIEQSQFQESWYLDSANNKSVYYASVQVDTISIDYAWEVDSTLTGIKDISLNATLRIYPNPANDMINIDLSGLHHQPLTLHVFNMMGETIYSEKTKNGESENISVNTSMWSEGIYFLVADDNQTRLTQKLMIAH